MNKIKRRSQIRFLATYRRCQAAGPIIRILYHKQCRHQSIIKNHVIQTILKSLRGTHHHSRRRGSGSSNRRTQLTTMLNQTQSRLAELTIQEEPATDGISRLDQLSENVVEMRPSSSGANGGLRVQALLERKRVLLQHFSEQRGRLAQRLADLRSQMAEYKVTYDDVLAQGERYNKPCSDFKRASPDLPPVRHLRLRASRCSVDRALRLLQMQAGLQLESLWEVENWLGWCSWPLLGLLWIGLS